MKKVILILITLLITTQNSNASVEFYRIQVDRFIEMGDKEYLLEFKPLDKIEWLKDSQKIFLYIRFNKRCITDLIQSKDIEKEKLKYFEAVQKLSDQVSRSKEIIFGLKSGKGFHLIPGKINEYQCDNLSMIIIDKRKIVYAIHSDIGSGYCVLP
jgi:hypothetical protein